MHIGTARIVESWPALVLTTVSLGVPNGTMSATLYRKGMLLMRPTLYSKMVRSSRCAVKITTIVPLPFVGNYQTQNNVVRGTAGLPMLSLTSLALVRSTLIRFAPSRSALVKSADHRFASVRSALVRFADRRVRPTTRLIHAVLGSPIREGNQSSAPLVLRVQESPTTQETPE